MAMTDEQKQSLKNIPKRVCHICKSKRFYTNPMERCFECEKSFCFDHINAGMMKKGMSENERVRDICDECVSKFGYKSI